MSVLPLTHHEILELVEPFTRRGLQVDLASSKRLERRLAFKPVEHAGAADDSPPLRETLHLDNPKPGKFRLTRTLTLPGGLEAALVLDGAQPAELLAQWQAIAPQRQIHCAPGYRLALSHRLSLTPSAGPTVPTPERLILTQAVAEVGGLVLKLRLPAVSGIPADIELLAAPGDTIDLPDDLLAVLGWPWSRLQRVTRGWTSVMRLRDKEPARSSDAEAKLRTTVEHLARTLAEPPARFHERLSRRRWGVTLRRAVPMLTSLALLGGAAALPKIDLAEDSVLRMLIFHAPPLLLVVFFCLREMPRIEIPPRPRALRAASWREPVDAAAAACDLQRS